MVELDGSGRVDRTLFYWIVGRALQTHGFQLSDTSKADGKSDSKDSKDSKTGSGESTISVRVRLRGRGVAAHAVLCLFLQFPGSMAEFRSLCLTSGETLTSAELDGVCKLVACSEDAKWSPRAGSPLAHWAAAARAVARYRTLALLAQMPALTALVTAQHRKRLLELRDKVAACVAQGARKAVRDLITSRLALYDHLCEPLTHAAPARHVGLLKLWPEKLRK